VQNKIPSQTAELVSWGISHVIVEHEVIAPIVYAIPLQVRSYQVAIIKGTNVDQPHNLANSVMVE
jgi:glucosamine 6-phosphate synthetase-like amidotransferase/phosphosugar isomerase protein